MKMSVSRQEKYDEVNRIKQENAQLLEELRQEEQQKVKARYKLFKEVHQNLKQQKQSIVQEKTSSNVAEKLNEIVSKKQMRAKSIADLEKLEAQLLE